MTGFRGQKFDFTGEDGKWYCLISDWPSMHVNMRVTTPVPSLPEITYITGISVVTTDSEGFEHSIVIEVTTPHSLESTCPTGVSPCLADSALSVFVDGTEELLQPGTVPVAPGVIVSAVNLPGACRSFGFEKYWERKKLEYAQVAAGRMLIAQQQQSMYDWILGDPTVTNMEECTEYVAKAISTNGDTGLFEHQSEHASFQIVMPTGTIRLSHGRLHQLPMRDPTDRFDLPDHTTWQMNLAFDHKDVSREATGILGETVVPTLDDSGEPIMQGMGAIRGSQEDWNRVLAETSPRDVVWGTGLRADETDASDTTNWLGDNLLGSALYQISVPPDSPPVRTKPYRMNPIVGKQVDVILDKYLAAGLIQHSTSPHCSPIVVVPKKSSGIRLAINYQRLDKVAASAEMPMPTNIKQLRSLLGGLGYYRSFLKDMVKRTKPLNALLKKGAPFVFTSDMEAAVPGLLADLSRPPVLVFPDWAAVEDRSRPFGLLCDASIDGLGATLE
eukprot:g11431.t1